MSTGGNIAASPREDPGPGSALSRRQLFAGAAKTGCAVALFGLAVGLYSRTSRSMPAGALRPPGALPEEEFLSACALCGLCAQDCPYDILKIAGLGEYVSLGTPYFVAREEPCRMCTDIPCVPACPTGALDHALSDITKARMGLAVLIDQENCIAFQGNRCEVCFNSCPLRDKAIRLDYRPGRNTGYTIFAPVVVSEFCTGCGLCERACILDQAAIKVLPVSLAKGGTPVAGRSQSSRPGPALPDPTPAMPFSANPLDTLNKTNAQTRQ